MSARVWLNKLDLHNRIIGARILTFSNWIGGPETHLMLSLLRVQVSAGSLNWKWKRQASLVFVAEILTLWLKLSGPQLIFNLTSLSAALFTGATTTLDLMRLSCLLIRRFNYQISRCNQRRSLLTLAIETSCDDTSVAVLEKHKDNSANTSLPLQDHVGQSIIWWSLSHSRTRVTSKEPRYFGKGGPQESPNSASCNRTFWQCVTRTKRARHRAPKETRLRHCHSRPGHASRLDNGC